MGYALDVSVTGNVIWTVSAWRSACDVAAFCGSARYREAVAVLGQYMAPSLSAAWTTPTADLPVPWDEVRSRLAAHVEL